MVLGGGLGNQLFGYAAARALSVRANVALKLDLRFYAGVERGSSKSYWLDEFPIKAEVVDYPSRKAAHSVRARVSRLSRERNKYFISGNGYSQGFDNLEDGVTIFGMPQSHKFFQDVYGAFKSEIDLSDSPKVEENPSIKSLKLGGVSGIHVRRGDYLAPENSDFAMKDWKSYYSTSVTEAKRHSSRVVIFSDDPEWCAQEKTFAGCEIFEGHSDDPPYIAMFAMSFCDRLYIANSTYSWWAGWFASSRGATVTAPEYWTFGNKSRDIDLIPDGWIVI